ncbi:hypothetical protein TCAL_00739 [Tigriopus californicus]|uniref:Craniofacial development protein 1 n=1 Tax=Tigriopus californicus TaxID=6832 RepID=A0A553PAQ1_TIGCA|nr:craniofacial development protein 1-like [Tigriopus californicus]TRY74756.1 hypothetical protein TCAL_00739 [Tigriopus californicus]|eukprot:TCALIF_00739-PA protein Name:"Similar to CFDP1 Craniofacial development protein 1 (Gallus gallus)" AED:0.03 eAED:0.03 QI:180/1/1/1/0.66/0.5/4/158/331
MGDFLHATDLGSDTDDEDYVPEEPQEVLSEEDDDGDVGQSSRPGSQKKSKKKNPGGPDSLKRGAIFELDEDEKRAEAQRRKEFDLEKVEIKAEEEKKKTDDLWADFKKESNAKPKPKPVAGTGLGALTSTVTSSKKGGGSRSLLSSIFDSKPAKENPAPQSKPRSLLSSIFDKKEESPKPTEPSKEVKEESNEDAKLKITQVFDFAGENVEVTKEVDKNSKEAQKFLKAQEKVSGSTATLPNAVAKRPAVGGLASIMNEISGKKKKMGCLDKSKMDWDSYVNKEGIKEELTTHNRGKDGFVEKQEFLERADLRRFELEKTAREKTRKTLNR